ncbi:tripartite tricarboxylate transporter substrate binding protein [Martelella mediterranea]|uniref:Bug family tripartite tricarboxylate transporter substrate binding protein n=1 Tax=Martelella mediterranea TaxID=293089 RepID=UPI001E411B00|nr:tripartite tricarboxylate transporter substrate binding protein [Martelella mediterranea]MCD1636454.1 tripartite tricarboxylate transporter substrate binding protein [Martelella mediterranea]
MLTQFLAAGLGVATLLAAPATVIAEEFPERPIKVIVPFKSGGGSDAIARIFQSAIEANDLVDVPIVVTNIEGPGGRIGSRTAKDAEPDGYTVLMNHMTLLTSEATGLADFGYRDFEPIAGTGDVCLTVAVAEDSPFDSLEEALAAASETPDTLTYGVNLGALNHMGGLLLQSSNEGSKFRFVQIGGDVANSTSLMGGHIDITAFSAGQFKASESAGLRGLAILADDRHPALPDIPTAKEQGFDVSYCFEYWWFVPAGTPEDRVEKLADVLEAAMQTEEVKTAFENRLTIPEFRRGAELDAYIADEYAKIEPVAAQAMSQ